MQKTNQIKLRVSLLQKIIFIICGLMVCLVTVEMLLRLGGFIFLAFQEHRNRISIAQSGSYRIMCSGESTTAFGGNDSYPSQLEKILNQSNAGIRFTVINKGVPGVPTSNLLAHLEDYLNIYKPNMVVTMMGINDEYQRVDHEKLLVSFIKSFRIYKLAEFLWSST